ncbi:unnamed protein product [Prorocentrum cordatum]|uniref:Pentacotripeptide-repeat region of PRORP domain-containing protein n=1 Tax=Prorocentrum cordatum TaxID=2364126 RepID=A0ABN9W0M3_9DINO|nr:unnamed protein product [Polarella glacialis]
MNALAEQGDAVGAEAVLRRLQPSTPPGKRRMLFNTMLKAFANAGLPGRAERLFEEMLEMRVVPNFRAESDGVDMASPVAFGSMMDAAAKSTNRKAADTWFRRARERGVELSPLMANSLVAAAGDSGDLLAAQRCFDQALEASVGRAAGTLSFDAKDLNVLLQDAAARDDLQCSEAWWAHAARARVEPDRIGFVTILGACAKQGDLGRAESLLAQAGDARVAADEKMLSAVINAAAKCGDLAAARRWLSQASAAGVQPNVVSISPLVDAAGKMGDLVAAEAWYEVALASGMEPNAFTLSGLLHAAARRKDLPRAEAWFERFAGQAGPLDSVPFLAMISAAAGARNLSAAEAWFVRAREQGVRPSVEMFNGLANAAAKVRDLEAARRSLDRCLAAGVEPNAYTFATLISAAASADDPAAADGFFRQMAARRARVGPDDRGLGWHLSKAVGAERAAELIARAGGGAR